MTERTGRRVPGRPPPVILPFAVFGLGLVLVPVIGLLVRAPWSDVADALGATSTREALRLSLLTSVSAAAIATLLGVPLAWVLARVAFPGRRLTRAVVLLPLVLPPVVGGVALLLAFGRNGLLGPALDTVFGVHLPFSTAGVVVAQAFVALPFVVVTVEAALRAADRGVEEAAATLGAGPLIVARRVTLPAIAPAIAAGSALAWARALGEFGATITFAGSIPDRTQTMPLAVFRELQTDLAGAVALSIVLLVVSIAVLVGLRERWLAPAVGR